MIAAELANIHHGGDRKAIKSSIELLIPPAISNGKAASLLNISEATVKRAKGVLRNGSPELIEAVKATAFLRVSDENGRGQTRDKIGSFAGVSGRTVEVLLHHRTQRPNHRKPGTSSGNVERTP